MKNNTIGKRSSDQQKYYPGTPGRIKWFICKYDQPD